MADEMEAGHPSPEGARWVPWRTVWIKDGIAPRGVDRDTVESYTESFFDLPPILVQRGSFALIDGRHRLEAASRALAGDSIRVREVDCSDDDLALKAFEANLANGRAYTSAEKKEGLKLMVRSYPHLAAAEIARRVGVHPETAITYKRQFEGRAELDNKNHGIRGSQERDSTINRQPRQPVTTFDPGPEQAEPEPDGERAWMEAHRKKDVPATVEAAPQAEAGAAEESRGGPSAAEPDPYAHIPAETREEFGFNDPAPGADQAEEQYVPFAFVRDGVIINAHYKIVAPNRRAEEAFRAGMSQLIQWATKAVGE